MIPAFITIRGVQFATRTLLTIAGIALIIIAALTIPSCVSKWRSERAQAKVDRAQSGAFQNSATDAVATQSQSNQREADSEAISRANQRTIRDAQGASDPVNPAVSDVGFNSLCRRKSFQEDARCKR